MNFEKDLIDELKQIEGMSDKVSMLTAQGDRPYIVCAKERIDFVRNLNGSTINTEAIYQINIVADSYAETQALVDKVVTKLLSFQQRYIGNLQTGVQKAMVQILPDEYVYEPEAFESTVRLTATL